VGANGGASAPQTESQQGDKTMMVDYNVTHLCGHQSIVSMPDANTVELRHYVHRRLHGLGEKECAECTASRLKGAIEKLTRDAEQSGSPLAKIVSRFAKDSNNWEWVYCNPALIKGKLTKEEDEIVISLVSGKDCFRWAGILRNVESDNKLVFNKLDCIFTGNDFYGLPPNGP
jgi:hypothetical protein